MTKLKEIHKGTYTIEQLNCWGHMIQAGTYSSMNSPPELPYFKTKKKENSKPAAAADSTAATADSNAATAGGSGGISPSKRVNLRGECMKQLETWHTLLEKGGIDRQQFEEVQHSILKDIKDNFI